ncbi:MAG: PEGA domain-containing protein [Porticoccaceae bacterium]|nr:PEGA domain-containing protein [Porticoccaceae bacterium]
MPDKNNKQPLSATQFKPLDAASTESRLPVSPGVLALAVLATSAVIIMLYLFVARAVIFQTEPQNAEIDISGLSFNIGDNYLLLSGEYSIEASAEGYYPLVQTITVSGQATQDLKLELQPLPGNLIVGSDITAIAASIDGEPAAEVPGTIKGISRGSHQIEFTKYRYFPLQQEIDIAGLGTTQSINVSMLPAWGEMQFNTEPSGANLYIDDRLIGQTPLVTEVLETGSNLRLQLKGYKSFEKRVNVKAGTSATHPPIALIVSDGILQISSAPAGAKITVDNQFLGTTPIDLPMAPFKKYRIELFLEGYLKATRSASLEPEATKAVNVNLKPNIGSIALTISPSDAQILVDNQPKGTGSRTLSLNAKPHTLTIKKAGYESKSLTVTPRPGHQQALSIKLLTVEEAYWTSRPPRIKSFVGTELKLFKPNQTFTMGAPRRQPGRRANEAERKVGLQRPFYLGRKEISNTEFRRWQEHSSSAIKAQSLDMNSQPVAKVSWEQAALYCNWLSRKEGLPPFYEIADGAVSSFNWNSHGYRLPTEAEWAWAARIDKNGNGKVFPWASNLYPPMQVQDNYADQSASNFLSFTIANYNDNYPVSSDIGSFKPNSNGLYNMSGNVSEWVNDYYDIRPNRGEPEIDPTGPTSGNRHVIRGASWALGSRTELRLSYRDAGTEGRLDVGFRIARYVDRPGAKP